MPWSRTPATSVSGGDQAWPRYSVAHRARFFVHSLGRARGPPAIGDRSADDLQPPHSDFARMRG